MLTRDREIGRTLSRADPEDLALLDLSLRRKVKDDVVAAVLRLQPEEVGPRRRAALDRLAEELGLYEQAERARLADIVAELPADQWPEAAEADRDAPADAPAEVESEASAEVTPEETPEAPASEAPAETPAEPAAAEPAAPEPAVAAAQPAKAKPERRRRPLLAAAVVVAGAIIGCVIGLLAFGGDSDDGDKKPVAAATPQPAAQSVAVTPIAPGFPGRGTARIEGSGTGSTLVMSLRDLPPREEAYAVWLYNSITDARLLDRVVGTVLDVNRRLPADPSRYKYIDVSREPIDDNPNHSGASVMRVPMAALLKNN